MWHAMHLPYGLPYAASQTHPEPSKRLLEAAMWRSGIGPRDQAAAPLSGRPRSTCMCGISHRGGGQPRCCLATWHCPVSHAAVHRSRGGLLLHRT